MALRETIKTVFDIMHDLANAPQGISRGEIVEKYNIGASTAHKYIRIIEDMGVPIYRDGQKYHVLEDYFVNLKLTSEEGEFLFLALERALTTHTSQSQIVRSLINKLSYKLHPHLAGEFQERFRHEQSNVEAARIFTTLVQAKRQRRVVLVDYLPLNRAEASRWRIRPYRFVSNPLSDGFYVLCDGSRHGGAYKVLSLKFDRIQDVQLCDDRFDIVDSARFQSHYGRAWGVWSSEGEPVQVVLRFEPRHYDRLLESNWHPTQSIHTDVDGYVIFRVDVAAPQEMTPWIRSWGSGVVVEEPPELRQRLIRGLKRQVRHYGLRMSDNNNADAFHLLWAKYERKTGDYHLLIYHLLDVAAVACCMWEDVLGAGQKTWLQDLLRLGEEATRGQLALLAGLHDIGKATPGFQRKAADRYEALCDADAGLREKGIHVDDHGLLSAVILQRWLKEKMGISKMRAGQLAAVIGGHHGAWILTNARQNARASAGKEKWKALQDELIDQLQAPLGVDAISPPEDPQAFNVFAAFLSGFVSVCDWVGSNGEHFEFEEDMNDLQAYFQRAMEQAREALNELGFIGRTVDGHEPEFKEAFHYLELEANELQRVAIDKLQALEKMPRLVLAEYLTGGGKTELALHIGDRLLNRFGLSGAYIAMPTQATSNQMFDRFADYLSNRYRRQNINLHLIHGQADQQESYQQMQPQADREGNESGLTAEDWFQPRKRALLAPFGVGTIDQAMLSVLQAKHHFVRQYALSQKLVIFDEIHSYDSYMNTIIERLFAWLHALNSPMILLSATLSRQGRGEILKAVGASSENMPEVRYPRLTIVEHDGKVRAHELPRPETRTVKLERIAPDNDSLLKAILPFYEQGGCMAIVCNTVNESIEIARFLREAEAIEADDVWLFHARFPPVWRKEREDEVLDAFGKESVNRPERAILVSTQIIEQSLDLDFDLMISRTAPIDLLIQRAGRLHRHEDRPRPPHLTEPTLLLRKPEMSGDDIPDFGDDEAIYAKFFLLKTWLKLRDMAALRSPDDIDALMDFVYSEDVDGDGIADGYREALEVARDEMGLKDTNSEFRGAQFVIGKPSDKRLIGRYSAELSDDEERNIATRNIRPGLDIICVMDEHLHPLTERKPDKNEVADLLRYRITIRNKAVKLALEQSEQSEESPHWQRIPQLKFARALIFEDQCFDVLNSPYTLRLTRDYGLEIEES